MNATAERCRGAFHLSPSPFLRFSRCSASRRAASIALSMRSRRSRAARQVAMYLCRKMTDSSFPTIGEHFARDHSTVIHAYNLIARRIASDSAFRFSIEKVERELKATPASAA